MDFDRARVIVELGAGTGPITEAVVSRLKPHTRFIAIERDGDFAQILRARFQGLPNMEIVHADVRDLDAILRDRGIDTVDAFISGLPTPALPLGVRRRMLAAIRRSIADHGVFSNITEFPWYYLPYYTKVFQSVDFQFVAVNMPPGGVYHCRRFNRIPHEAAGGIRKAKSKDPHPQMAALAGRAARATSPRARMVNFFMLDSRGLGVWGDLGGSGSPSLV